VRILFYTDAHLCGTSPENRTDNYPMTMICKMRELYGLAQSEGCDCVAFGGDFFHTHRIFAYDVIGGAVDAIRSVGIPTYACVGEHDLHGHNIATFPSSTLAFLCRICPEYKVLFEPVEHEKGFVFTAKHEYEPVSAIMGDAMKLNASNVNILLCHELITNGRAPFDVTSTSTLDGSLYDLVLSGDLHMGYQPHRVGNTWFANPGALARRATNDTWTPKVAIIDIEKGKETKIVYVPIKCAKLHAEVFDLSGDVLRAEARQDVSSAFAEELLKFEAEAIDIHDLIQKMGAQQGIDRRVLDYLARKRDTLAEGDQLAANGDMA